MPPNHNTPHLPNAFFLGCDFPAFLAGFVLDTTMGFPKNASSRGWVPPLYELIIFFIPASTLCSEKDFSPTKNALRASSSIFFSHLSSTSLRTLGSLKRTLTSS